MRNDQPSYRRDIDGLRALAVAAIVVHHAFPAVLPGGFVGVDVFFVISGFLITRILVEARDEGRFSWGAFYLRRARRIVPAYVLVTLVTVALAAWIEMPRLLVQTGAAAAASGLFLANVLAAQSPGYFAPSVQQNPLLHLWSLGVEEQFYLVWPALIGLLSLGWLRRARTALALGLLAASLALAQILVAGGGGVAAFFHLPARAWEFLAGGVLALGLAPPAADRRVANLAAASGLLAIGWSLIALTEASPFPGVSAVPACLGAALLVWSGQDAAPGATTILRAAPVVAVGRVSYALYLWHWPLLVLAADVAQQPLTIVQRLGLMVLSLGLAALTWRFVEQPLRRGPADRPWRRLGGLLLLLLAPVAAGATLFLSHGLPQRLSPDARALARLEETDVNPARKACFEQADRATPQQCRFGAPPGSQGDQVLVWGDSHADAVTPGVVAWARSRNWSVGEVARGGCPPLVGVRVRAFGRLDRGCEAWAARTLERIATDRQLTLVVLAARWPLYRDAPPFYDVNSPRVAVDTAGQPGVRPALSAALTATLDAIARRRPDLRVVVIGPVPELTLAPPECLAQQRQLGGRAEVCAWVEAGPPLARATPAEAEIRAAVEDRPGVAVVFPTETLCRHDGCVAVIAGRPIYFDDDHLSASGARRLVPSWMDDGWRRLAAPLGEPPATARR
ncbi:acyltransferase family protein [Caulobacter sp. BK020]|uniref:acyltransferase family protein n=1 Tax=Caulobacter sp. BK020 TaxID=2512117 RepID=UPI0010DDCCD3|nr:acyltransferase family protein [Caulobacter sp. BK020]TCS13225.1 peptidoglycan/LPS O-acetylase OafA/YrhL [Caulobacter sp. BK020]